MNIFILDTDPIKAARYECDKHVVKMIVESCQLLCTTLREFGINETWMYKSTHVNHPCSKWVLESWDNFDWLVMHFVVLLDEYEKRYNKEHKCNKMLEPILKVRAGIGIYKVCNFKTTPFALAMPQMYKQENAVEAYRNYYRNEKKHFAKWKLGNIPEWWRNEKI